MTSFSSSLCQSQADIQITMALAHTLLLSIDNTLRIEKAINVPLQNNLHWLTAIQICNKEVSAAAKHHLLLASTPSKIEVHLQEGSGQHGDLRSKLLGTWLHRNNRVETSGGGVASTLSCCCCCGCVRHCPAALSTTMQGT